MHWRGFSGSIPLAVKVEARKLCDVLYGFSNAFLFEYFTGFRLQSVVKQPRHKKEVWEYGALEKGLVEKGSIPLRLSRDVEPNRETHRVPTNIMGKNNVYDIGGSNLRARTLQAVKTGLTLPQPRLPDLVFSDAKGMALWSHIQHLPNYYQARDEINLLREISPVVCSYIRKGGAVIDLGAG